MLKHAVLIWSLGINISLNVPVLQREDVQVAMEGIYIVQSTMGFNYFIPQLQYMASSMATYGISYSIYMVRVPMGLRVKQTSLSESH